MTRRELVAAMAAVGLPFPAAALAQQSVLPLHTPGLDHLDVIVPDVEKSATFYMGLFKTALHAQPFRGKQRYFVLLAPLTADRRVGYLAVGASDGRGTYIGHFCTSVEDLRRDSAAIVAGMKEQFRSAGLGEFTGGAGIFKDPDGIEIQFLPSPDTLVTAAVPSALVPAGQGLVTPQRVDHAVLHVSDLKRAVKYYRVLYGKESRASKDGVVFAFRNGSRLLLEETSYAYGKGQARIARFGIRVNDFDRAAAAKGIAALGGTVVQDDGKALRLRDVDGIELELVTG
ncbi:MAG: VOC family protein [Steroidobacteraceae bacterium]